MEPSGLAFGKPKGRLREIQGSVPAFRSAQCGLRSPL